MKYWRLLTSLASVAMLCTSPCHGQQDPVEQAVREEIRRLEGIKETPGYQEHKTKTVQAQVKPVPVPAQVEPSREDFPAGSRNVTVAGGNFVRERRPVFLIGVEAEQYNGAWLHRILGIDFSQATVTTSAGFRSALQATERRGADGRFVLDLSAEREDPWLETRIKEALRGGTLFTCDFGVTKRSFYPAYYTRYEFDPPLYCPGVKGFRKTSSHFLDLCQESPAGRELYLNMLRWYGRRARKYPVFLYEVVNEVSYICPCAKNARRFQAAMKTKFGTIEKANRTWGTKYTSFDQVIPPLNIDSSGIYNSKWGAIPYGKDLSVPLWIDWMRFMEQRALEVFADLRREQQRIDPRAKVVFQTPYWQGKHAQFPHTLISVEDFHGAEHGLVLFRQEAGREDWDQIKHMFAQQLANDLVRSASMEKPSINLECRCVGYPHDKLAPQKGYRIGAAGIRTFFWHQAVHGVGGSVLSYFYDNEISEGGGSVWDPRFMTLDAVRELPRVKNEILSVADIVLPRPRIRGVIGFVYPRESARIIRPERKGIHQQFVPEVLDWYAATVLTRVPTDVLIGQQILGGQHRKYPMLVLAHCGRALPGVVEALTAYVRDGGVLVISADSLLVDDAFGRRLDTTTLLGGRVDKEILKEEDVRFQIKGIPAGKTLGLRATPASDFDFRSPVFGYQFKPQGAEVLGRTASGEPALTSHSLGKGKVYYLAREFAPEIRRALIGWIVKRHGLRPEVDVEFADGVDADYVETHLFKAEGRSVIYALNFGGGPRRARLKLVQGLPPAGKRAYVRSIRPDAYLAPGGKAGKAAWKRSDLERGIDVTLPMHDPIVLLVEDEGAAPLRLRQMTAEQEGVLSWLYRPSPKAPKRVLIDGVYVAEGRVHKWRMPTAVKLLEDNGYQVNSLCAPLRKPLMRSLDGVRREDLSSYDVFILSGTHGRNEWEDADVRAVHNFVKNGGGLVCCLIREWHHAKPQKVLEALGIQPIYSYFHDPKHHIVGEPKYVTFRNIADHPVTKGVKLFQSTGAKPLAVRNPKATVLIRGSDSSYAYHSWGQTLRKPHLPVMAALEYGKGRVVVIGTDTWLLPDDLKLGDNRRLFLNAINWLAETSSRRQPRVPSAPSPVAKLKPAPAPTKSPNVVRLWTFEQDTRDWLFGKRTGAVAYTGKACLQAGRAKPSAWYDVLIRTRWYKAGLLDLPKDPHVNLAFCADRPTFVQVRVEIGKTSPRARVSAAKGKWTYVSLPINRFERPEGDQAGRRLMEIQVYSGNKGDGVTLSVDDISVSSGPVPDPRAKAAKQQPGRPQK